MAKKKEAVRRPVRGEASPEDFVTHKCGCKLGVRAYQNSFCKACSRKAKTAQNLKKNQKQAGRSKLNYGRLPDGSVISIRYDAKAVCWRGQLTTLVGGEGRTFVGEASGVVLLLGVLDGQYRTAKIELAALPDVTGGVTRGVTGGDR